MLLEEIISIFSDETTARALVFAFRFLAFHPEMQEKILEENKRVFEEREDIDYDDVKKLEYALSVFRETLRMIPIVPNITKVATKKTNLCGYTIPEGTFVNIDVVGLHRNPQYWENSSEFRPDRFLKSARESSQFQWVPFSNGKRSCIGTKFAEIEATLILSLLTSRYHIICEEGVEPNVRNVQGGIVLGEKEETFLSFKMRTQKQN